MILDPRFMLVGMYVKGNGNLGLIALRRNRDLIWRFQPNASTEISSSPIDVPML